MEKRSIEPEPGEWEGRAELRVVVARSWSARKLSLAARGTLKVSRLPSFSLAANGTFVTPTEFTFQDLELVAELQRQLVVSLL